MSFPKLIVGSSPDGIFDLSGLLAGEPVVAPASSADELDLIRRSRLVMLGPVANLGLATAGCVGYRASKPRSGSAPQLPAATARCPGVLRHPPCYAAIACFGRQLCPR